MPCANMNVLTISCCVFGLTPCAIAKHKDISCTACDDVDICISWFTICCPGVSHAYAMYVLFFTEEELSENDYYAGLLGQGPAVSFVERAKARPYPSDIASEFNSELGVSTYILPTERASKTYFSTIYEVTTKVSTRMSSTANKRLSQIVGTRKSQATVSTKFAGFDSVKLSPSAMKDFDELPPFESWEEELEYPTMSIKTEEWLEHPRAKSSARSAGHRLPVNSSGRRKAVM